MALHFLSTPMRTFIRQTPRTEFRYLYTSYYMSHLKHKVCPDQTTSHNHLSSDFVNDPTPISPFSSTSSPVHGSPRHFATSVNDASKWLNIKKKVGHATGLGYRYPKWKMHRAALKLYLCCTEMVQFDELFDYLEVPDTYLSYFLLLHLHVWFVISRVAQDGDEGAFMKKAVLRYLWDDQTERTKKLMAKGVLKNRHESLGELHEQSTAALFAYDEGALGDDRVLAGSLWRILFQKDCDDPQKICRMVHYVRKQMAHLDRQPSDILLANGVVTFLPFEGDTLEYDVSLKQIQRVLLGSDRGNLKFSKLIKDPTALRLLDDKK